VQSKFGGRGQARRASTDDEDRQLSLIGNAIVSHGVMVVATECASIRDATQWHALRGPSDVLRARVGFADGPSDMAVPINETDAARCVPRGQD
jgi:hypothetical protein